jgi:hypothetical protein
MAAPVTAPRRRERGKARREARLVGGQPIPRSDCTIDHPRCRGPSSYHPLCRRDQPSTMPATLSTHDPLRSRAGTHDAEMPIAAYRASKSWLWGRSRTGLLRTLSRSVLDRIALSHHRSPSRLQDLQLSRAAFPDPSLAFGESPPSRLLPRASAPRNAARQAPWRPCSVVSTSFRSASGIHDHRSSRARSRPITHPQSYSRRRHYVGSPWFCSAVASERVGPKTAPGGHTVCRVHEMSWALPERPQADGA